MSANLGHLSHNPHNYSMHLLHCMSPDLWHGDRRADSRGPSTTDSLSYAVWLAAIGRLYDDGELVRVHDGPVRPGTGRTGGGGH
jgi:hypothetical protein